MFDDLDLDWTPLFENAKALWENLIENVLPDEFDIWLLLVITIPIILSSAIGIIVYCVKRNNRL